MAGDLFFWPCACVFVLCEHMAFVLVFCVPCALVSIVSIVFVSYRVVFVCCCFVLFKFFIK